MKDDKIPVFDIGDTLVPSRRFVANLLEDELRKRNHKPVHHFDPDRFGIYDASGIERYLKKYDLEGDSAGLARRCRERYLEAFEDLLIENDVFDLLARCNREFGTIGIISDNTIEAKKLLKEKLGKHGVDYDTIVVSDEIGVEKPDPEIFRTFVERRDEKPEKFVYIGNDAERDSGAKKIGMNFVWLTEFDTVNSEYDGPKLENLAFQNLKQVINSLD